MSEVAVLSRHALLSCSRGPSESASGRMALEGHDDASPPMAYGFGVALMFQHLAPERIFSLDGKVALITGAAGGIAAGLTQGFAAAGARLVLVDRNEAV